MENVPLEQEEPLVMDFPSPVYAHAFELAREFTMKWEELAAGKITEANWVAFWESRKGVNVTKWL